jgi:hypothetical protein
MKKKILILVFSDLSHDARVRRQINALKSDYEVTVIAFNGKADGFKLMQFPSPKMSFMQKALSSGFLLTGINDTAYDILYPHRSFIRESVATSKFDVVIANDVETLPLAFEVPGNPKVIFDAHEYAPRHFEDKRWWRIFFQKFNVWLCKKYLPKVSAMMTVGKGLAREYEKNFGVKPVVVTNAGPFADLKVKPVSEKIRLVHHGIVNPSRSLDLMIDMMKDLDDRFTLDMFLLIPNATSARSASYLEYLKTRAAANPRVKIHPPIPGNELVTKLNDFDIGVFVLPPVNFNYANTLPNKLFDFIQARLAIAIGPTPEMAEIVTQFKNGVVAANFTAPAIASLLQNLSFEDIQKMKANSSEAAQVHNAAHNQKIILELVSKVALPRFFYICGYSRRE